MMSFHGLRLIRKDDNPIRHPASGRLARGEGGGPENESTIDRRVCTHTNRPGGLLPGP